MNAVPLPQARITHRFACKVLAAAFCGIHIPLIALLVYFLLFSPSHSRAGAILAVLLTSFGEPQTT